MERSNEKPAEVTEATELTDEQLDAVTGGVYRHILSRCYVGGSGTNAQLWVVTAT